MGISNQLKNQHLMWRAGFGPLAEDHAMVSQHSQKALFQAMLKASLPAPEYLNVANNMFHGLMMGIGEAASRQRRDIPADEKKQFRKQSREDIRSLNLAWLNEMVNSEAQLREKMALFWHGHFATRNLNIYYQQLLLDVIRRNALGSFADLLFAVSKSAAMINFLNNNQNRKDHPNENFAREVMELFTLGRGHYTEQDVKEAARAFTGWSADLNGSFVFRPALHDRGTKTIFGESGPWDGDDVLNLLLARKQTAVFITRKVYRFFVNDQVDEARVLSLAEKFYESRYDIRLLMTEIFTSEWFYDRANIGIHIKSPVELLAGIRRQLPMGIGNPEALLLVQRLMGQLLFNPPNVAGWPGGRNWIDSSSLMLRLKIPEIIYSSDVVSMQPKEDDDRGMGMGEPRKMQEINRPLRPALSRMVEASIDWGPYIRQFGDLEGRDLLAGISSVLLQCGELLNEEALESHMRGAGREEFIKAATIRLMCTPEYQLC